MEGTETVSRFSMLNERANDEKNTAIMRFVPKLKLRLEKLNKSPTSNDPTSSHSSKAPTHANARRLRFSVTEEAEKYKAPPL